MKWMINHRKTLISVIGAVLLISCIFIITNNKQSTFSVHIVHTNDIHAHVNENEKHGIIGIEKLATIISDYKKNSDIELVLDSGDLFQGQPIATLVYGESIAKLVKACGYDAMTAGNHDWSFGSQKLKDLADEANIKMLTGNVVYKQTNEQFFEDKYLIESIEKDGVTLKIGVFGVIDPTVYNGTSPENVNGLLFTDSIEYAQKAANELKSMNCNLIIGLTHSNHPENLAASVSGVDLWLTGHEHVSMNSIITAPNGSDTCIIQNGCFLQEIGLIELNCSIDHKGLLKDIEYNVDCVDYEQCAETPIDLSVSKVLDQINDEVNVILNDTVGYCPADLNGSWESLRTGETNLGVAVADSYLLVSDADIAFENAGGIRASVNQGTVTYADILAVSPYGNYLIKKQISGSELRSILETSLEIQRQCIIADQSGIFDSWPQNSGSVLQCSGITLEYDSSRPKGSRILSLFVNQEECQNDEVYTVITNNFTAWDSNYPELADRDEAGQYCSCEEALIKYFSREQSSIEKSVNTKHVVPVN